MFNLVLREKLVQELEQNSLKIKKCNPDVWCEMLQSNTRSRDLKTQKMQGSILVAVGAISKVTNTLLEVKNSNNWKTTTLSQNISTIVHYCTDSLALLSPVNTDVVNTAKLAWSYCILPRQSITRIDKKCACWFRISFRWWFTIKNLLVT